MTRSAQNIKKLMEETGIYKFSEENPLNAELLAYDAGFKILEDEFNLLFGDLFIQTASEENLNERELLFRPHKSLADIETRRRMLVERNSISENDYTEEKINKMLVAAGIDGYLTEKYNGGIYVNAANFLGVSQTEAKREFEALAPVHLPVTWSFS